VSTDEKIENNDLNMLYGAILVIVILIGGVLDLLFVKR
jgi:hypothetical protein